MVQEHRDALNAHSKGKARKFFGIDLAVFQDVGIYHPAAANFQPTGSFGNAVIGFGFKSPININFGTGFGKRKITRAQPDFGLPKHLLGKIQQRLFQVGKGNVFVDIQAFYLVKNTMRTG